MKTYSFVVRNTGARLLYSPDHQRDYLLKVTANINRRGFNLNEEQVKPLHLSGLRGECQTLPAITTDGHPATITVKPVPNTNPDRELSYTIVKPTVKGHKEYTKLWWNERLRLAIPTMRVENTSNVASFTRPDGTMVDVHISRGTCQIVEQVTPHGERKLRNIIGLNGQYRVYTMFNNQGVSKHVDTVTEANALNLIDIIRNTCYNNTFWESGLFAKIDRLHPLYK